VARGWRSVGLALRDGLGARGQTPTQTIPGVQDVATSRTHKSGILVTPLALGTERTGTSGKIQVHDVSGQTGATDKDLARENNDG
jgi:hypothetical protein